MNNEENIINNVNKEIDTEINKLLTEYDNNNTNIVGDQCPNFFNQMKNKFFTFSNKGKDKVRQYLVNKITTEKNSLSAGDPRIAKLDYFLDKICKCTGTCQATLQETNFINKPAPSIFSFFTGSKGGKRKTHRKNRGGKRKTYKKNRKTYKRVKRRTRK